MNGGNVPVNQAQQGPQLPKDVPVLSLEDYDEVMEIVLALEMPGTKWREVEMKFKNVLFRALNAMHKSSEAENMKNDKEKQVEKLQRELAESMKRLEGYEPKIEKKKESTMEEKVADGIDKGKKVPMDKKIDELMKPKNLEV